MSGSIGGAYIGVAAQVADSVITNAKLASPPSLTLVGSTTLGGAATSITVSSLNLDSDLCYFFILNFKHVDAAAGSISLYYNSDTTAGNYATVRIGGNGIAAAATSTGDAILNPYTAAQNESVVYYGYILRNIGTLVTCKYSACNFWTANWEGWHKWTTAATNVTGVTFTNNKASGFGTGSYLKIYKVG